jgi:hypothetical protein
MPRLSLQLAPWGQQPLRATPERLSALWGQQQWNPRLSHLLGQLRLGCLDFQLGLSARQQ